MTSLKLRFLLSHPFPYTKHCPFKPSSMLSITCSFSDMHTVLLPIPMEKNTSSVIPPNTEANNLSFTKTCRESPAFSCAGKYHLESRAVIVFVFSSTGTNCPLPVPWPQPPEVPFCHMHRVKTALHHLLWPNQRRHPAQPRNAYLDTSIIPLFLSSRGPPFPGGGGHSRPTAGAEKPLPSQQRVPWSIIPHLGCAGEPPLLHIKHIYRLKTACDVLFLLAGPPRPTSPK